MPATTVLDAIHLWLRPNETAWYEGHDLPTFEQVYVPVERGHDDPAERLIERFEYSTLPERAFVTGQKGAGKSMALRRIRDHRWTRTHFLPVVVRATETLPPARAPGPKPGQPDRARTNQRRPARWGGEGEGLHPARLAQGSGRYRKGQRHRRHPSADAAG